MSASEPKRIAPRENRWLDTLDRQRPALVSRQRGDARVPSPLAHSHWDHALFEPVRDILGRPSKAFRAVLVEAAFRLVKPRGDVPDAALALLEGLHAGSLIVDDIEDGSTWRRGAPSVHLIYGMPRALNAGNWMYFWAMGQIEQMSLPDPAARQLYRKVTETLSDCHRGQALDLSLQLGDVRQDEIPLVVGETTALKTAALTELAAFVGGTAAGANPSQVSALSAFGHALGMALQKLDDLGNLTGRIAPGKRHEDLANARLTWPWAWAAETMDQVSFARLESVARAIADHRNHGRVRTQALAGRLVEIAGPHRRRAITAELAHAAQRLDDVFGDSPVLGHLRGEIQRLEASYE